MVQTGVGAALSSPGHVSVSIDGDWKSKVGLMAVLLRDLAREGRGEYGKKKGEGPLTMG